MANITVDIQAKVVGYEASVKAFQAALAKVDPGSDIGKKLTSALTQAQKQIQDLAKNMFPKASSDQQIDAIVERVNRAGEALQNVATIFQSVDIKDLNIGALGAEFSSLQKEIQSITNTITSNLNTELVNAVENSNELKAVFESIGTDLSQATAVSLFEDLNNGAKDVTESLEKAQKEYDQFQSKIQKTQAELTQLEASPISNAEKAANLNTELKAIGNDYKKAFEDLRTTMSNNMEAAFKGKGVNSKKLLDTFFKDLSPDNIRQRIEDLFKELVSSNVVGAREKTAFYSQVFGIDNANINKVLSNINLTGARDTAKEKIAEFMATINDSLKESDKLQINDLLNENKITEALDKTKKIITSRLKEIEKEIQEHQANLKKLEGDAAGAQTKVQNASAAQQNIDTARKNLEEQLRLAQEKNVDLSNKLVEAERQVEALRANAVGGVHTGAETAGRLASTSRFPTTQAEEYKSKLAEVVSAEQMVGRLQGVVQRWFSIYAAVRMVGNAIRSMVSTIKELDATITEIAIVTNKTQSELWGQMPEYTAMARKYAASISGVYKVSQLYYQQGLGQEDVMALSEQTLKMARISGLDYAQATDYMTNAVRSFKLEMQDAQTVVDTYSAVAAKSATSVTELATAMSKTASSAQSVGASLQNTTAMMAVMIEATRESPENIGSAMKSIISRYGELKQNKTGIDAEGEEYSLNKVDKALQSVGISIHDAKGEFRDFDDVIMELADHWNTIDKNTQRYIATIMAGNRQQSRFLALVSSGERLRELSDTAANSEDAAQLQFLKTLDSVAAKTQQLETSIQSLYVNSGLEGLYKSLLDIGNSIMTTLDGISNNFGLGATITKVAGTFISLATLVTNAFRSVKLYFSNVQAKMTAEAELHAAQRLQSEVERSNDVRGLWDDELKAFISKEEAMERVERARTKYQKAQLDAQASSRGRNIGMAASAAGLAVSTLAASINANEQRQLKSILTGSGSVLQGIGTFKLMGGGWVGALMAAVTALPGILEAIGMFSESVEDKVNRLQEAVENANNERIQSKNELKSLTDYKAKYEELSKAQYESAEKQKEFIELQNEIAATYPELIKSMDEEGNYVVNMAESYEKLAAAKRDAYRTDLVNSAAETVSSMQDADYVLKNIYGKNPVQNNKSILGLTDTDYIEKLLKLDYHKVTEQQIRNNFNAREFWQDVTAEQQTLQRIFTGKYDAVGSLYFEDLSNTAEEIYVAFIEQMKTQVDLVTAKTNVKNQFASKYADLIDAFDSNVYEQLQLRYKLPDYQKTLANNQISTYGSELINLLSDSVESAFGIESSDIQKRFIKESMMDEWNTYLDQHFSELESGKLEWSDAVKNFFNERQEFWYSTQREAKVVQELTAEQNKYYQDRGKYTLTELLSKFPDLTEFITNIFNKDFEQILKNYQEWLDSEEVKAFSVSDLHEMFGPEYLQQIQSQYIDIINSSLSNLQKTKQIGALNTLYNTVGTSSLNSNQKQGIVQNFISNDLSTLTGIHDTINYIEDLNLGAVGDAIIKDLKSLEKTLNVNLVTEFSSLSNKVVSEIEKFEKAISNAGKGMDLKTATEMATKLGKSIKKDFLYKNGKYYYQNFSDIEDAYIDFDNELLNSLVEKKNSVIETIQGLKFVKTNSFDINRINEEGYLQSWETELVTQGFSMDQVQNMVDHTISNGNQYFNLFEALENRNYLESWAKELKSVGFKSTDDFLNYENAYERLEKTRDLKRNTSERLSQVTKNDVGISIDQLLAKYHNNLTDVLNAVNSEDYQEFEGIDKSTLSGYITAFFDRTGEDLQLNFSDWIVKYLNEIYEENKAVIDEYKKDQTARAYLSNGNIQGFMDIAGKYETADFIGIARGRYGAGEQADRYARELANNANEKLHNAIATGDISNLPEKLRSFSTLIVDTYQKTASNITNSIFDAVEGGSTQIAIDDTNRDYIKALVSQHSEWFSFAPGDDIDHASYINILTAAIEKDEEGFNSYLKGLNLTRKQKADYIKKWHEIHYPDPSKIASSMITSSDRIDYSTLQDLMASLQKANETDDAFYARLGLTPDELGAKITDREAYINTLNEQIAQVLDPEQKRNLKAELQSAERTKTTQTYIDTSKAIKEVLNNVDNVSEDSRKLFEAALGIDLGEKYLTDLGDGTHKLDVDKLRTDIESGVFKLGEEEKKVILNSFAALGDNALSAISKASSLISKGTNNQTDIQNIINDFNNKYTKEELFDYNTILDSFTLKPELMQEYLMIQAQKYADSMHVSLEEAIDEVSRTTTRELASAIDIDAFFKAENHGIGSKARDTLITQIANYRAITDPVAAKKLAEIDVQILEAGGDAAVKHAQQFADLVKHELSSDEIDAIYYAKANELSKYAESINELTVGSYIADSNLRTILQEVGIVDTQGVVTNLENVAEAYKNIYKTLSNTSAKTATQMNNIYAQYLTAQEQGDIDAIAAMGDAMGMTYSALGNLLGKTGQSLELWLDQNKDLYDKIGNGKIRINDFSKFAASQGWLPGSEEYTSGLKAYNNSLIEINRKVEKTIIEEVKALEGAKGGDLINVTELWSKLGTNINDALIQYGGYIDKGILHLYDDANLIGIASTLKTAAENAGVDLTTEVEQLADIVKNVIKTYIEAIRKGITGGLTSVEANNLTNIGKSLGLNNISFVETAEGLKVAQESAFELYNIIKQIDATQGHIVFEELSKRLQDENEQYETMSSTLNRIVQLRSLRDTEDPTKKRQYEAELAVAEEISRVRAASEDSSFNFMSNKIPGGQNNPLNYYSNWATAIQKLQTAMKTKSKTSDGKTHKGLIDYQDWYNIVTEMNNMAKLGGPIKVGAYTLSGDLQDAADLIEAGAKALTVTKTGEVKVALGDIGISFKAGADDMSKGIDTGLDAIADSQISMLDGMIQLLETVVAMEKLGDIDSNKDNKIDLSELFPEFEIEGFEGKARLNKKALEWADNIINATKDSDLGKAFDNLLINDISLRDWVKKAKTEGLNKQDAQDFTNIIAPLYQMLTSNEYDLNDIYTSLQQIAGQAKLSGTFRLSEDSIVKIENGAVIIETEDKNHKKTYQSPDGQVWGSAEEAIGAAMLAQWKGEGINKNENGIMNATIPIDGETVTIQYNAKTAKVEVVGADGNTPYNSLNDFLDAFIANEGKTGEEALQRKAELEVELGLKAADNKADVVINPPDVSPIQQTLNASKFTATVDLHGVPDWTNDTTNTETPPNSGGGGGGTRYNQAQAKGTLMGELGPELVVSNGRYFVAGQNGPEMVNLADDAIVFNHLQTKSLLEKGTSSGRGKAVTSERKAVAYARGNVHGGPAKASAQAALNALKELRAQWQALKNLSAKDLAGKAGGGGGGKNDAAFIKQLERWYNLLQEIAKLEEKITYQEQLRSTISSNLNKNGEAYYKSQKQSYEYLKRQAAAQQQLALEQQDYFEKRRKELNEQNGPFSSLYQFDEEGQIKYKDGKFEWLSKLAGTNPNTGKPNYSVEQQYKKLIDAGYGKYMKYDSEGKKIDTTKVEGKKEAIEAFWDKIEADQKEMQDLHDSVEEHKKAVLEVEEKQNELLKEIQDNQIAVEDAVLNAVVSASQREIDENSKKKDAIQESNQALLDGLTSALEKERNMYENQQSEADLSSKRRKLAILQRSGGSASEISTLQAEINDATKDLYFQKQQEQIDAIQEASDLQIEKLEQQIDLQQQSLDYAKEHGLLWGKVYDIMQKTPQDIYDYISSNNPDYWSMSPTTLAQKSEEVLFQAKQWTSYRDDIGEIKDVLMGKTNKEWSAFDKMMGDSKTTSTAWNKLTSDQKDSLQKIFMDEFEASGDANKAAEAVRKSKLYTEIFGSTGGGKKGKKVEGTGGGDMVDVTGKKGGGKTGGKTGATYVTSRYAAKDATSHYKIDVYSDKSEKKYTEPHTLEWIYGAVSGRWDKRCTKCGYVSAVSYNTTKPQYKEGGMDYEGGEAILHGTKSRPEAVLNAEQTKVLRDNIISNKPNSLINLLKSYNEAYEGLSTGTYDSINNTDNGVTIEHAEVNVSVEKLANSYDATRAGEDIMREMLNIARKTKAQNRVGR